MSQHDDTPGDRTSRHFAWVFIAAYALAFVVAACGPRRAPAISIPEPYYEHARQLWCSGKRSDRERAWKYVEPLTVETRLAWLVQAQDECS